VATRGPSRQTWYHRDRVPSNIPQSESRDYASRTTNVTSTATGSGSTDSSDQYNSNNSPGGGGLQPQPPPPQQQQQQHGFPSPKQLHADYSHRLHKNQVARGHHNFVVGGAHGRYRDYGGTLIEVPEEVYAVRKAALTVLEPITYCWVS
jgi:hypothetical protein